MCISLYELWNKQKRIDNTETINEVIYDMIQIQYVYINEFDWKKYALMYPDLESDGILSETQLYGHWIQYGENEGRCAGIVNSVQPYIDFDTIQYALVNTGLD